MKDRFDPLFTRILIASEACISTIVIGESDCAIVDWCIRSRDHYGNSNSVELFVLFEMVNWFVKRTNERTW